MRLHDHITYVTMMFCAGLLGTTGAQAVTVCPGPWPDSSGQRAGPVARETDNYAGTSSFEFPPMAGVGSYGGYRGSHRRLCYPARWRDPDPTRLCRRRAGSEHL